MNKLAIGWLCGVLQATATAASFAVGVPSWMVAAQLVCIGVNAVVALSLMVKP